MPQFSDQAPRAAYRRRHVRSGRRRRALSAIRAAVQRAEGASSRAEKAEGAEIVVADMTVAYKLDPRDLHQPRHARPAEAANPGRISRRPVQPHGKPLEISAGRRTGSATWNSSSPTSFAAACSAMLMGAMFDTAFRRFAGAFEKRADEIYGKAADQFGPSRGRSRSPPLRRDRAACEGLQHRCLRTCAGRYRRSALAMDELAAARSARRNAPVRPAFPPCRRPARRCR